MSSLELVALPGLARKKKQQSAKLKKSIYKKQLAEDNFDSLELAAEVEPGSIGSGGTTGVGKEEETTVGEAKQVNL